MKRLRTKLCHPVAAVLLITSLPVTTQAQQMTPVERARALVVAARQHYDHGRCDAASDLLSEAYRLQAEPALLFNLGRAYECAGKRDAAIQAYRSYLAAAAEPANRAEAEQYLARLEREVAEQQRRDRELAKPTPIVLRRGITKRTEHTEPPKQPSPLP